MLTKIKTIWNTVRTRVTFAVPTTQTVIEPTGDTPVVPKAFIIPKGLKPATRKLLVKIRNQVQETQAMNNHLTKQRNIFAGIAVAATVLLAVVLGAFIFEGSKYRTQIADLQTTVVALTQTNDVLLTQKNITTVTLLQASEEQQKLRTQVDMLSSLNTTLAQKHAALEAKEVRLVAEVNAAIEAQKHLNTYLAHLKARVTDGIKVEFPTNVEIPGLDTLKTFTASVNVREITPDFSLPSLSDIKKSYDDLVAQIF